jgi:hypothetical protein
MEIIKKANNTPGPGKYQVQSTLNKNGGSIKSKSPRDGFYEDSKAIGMLTPGHIYDVNSPLTQSKIIRNIDIKKKIKSTTRADYEIEKRPSLNAYDPLESLKKTQFSQYNVSFGDKKRKLKSYLDDAVFAKKDVPGVGNYKEAMNAY